MILNPYGKGAASGAYEELKKVEADYGSVSTQLEQIADKTIPAYGVAYAGTSSPALTRTLNAVGLTAVAQVGNSPVANNFDDLSPWKDIVRVNLADDGTVNAIYGDPTYKADGTNGQVMVRIPKFWYKVVPVVPTTQPVYQVSIAPTTKAGYEIHPAFAGRKLDGGDLDCIYIGAYDAGTDGTKLTSISGAFPYASATRAAFRTRARARGTNWAQEDFLSASALQLLYLVEYANLNSQAALGQGMTSLSYTATCLATVAATTANYVIIATSNAAAFEVGLALCIGTSQGGNQIASDRTITVVAAYDGTNTRITFDGAPVTTAVGNMVYQIGQKAGRCDAIGQKSGREAGTDGRTAIIYRGVENLFGNVWDWLDGLNISDYAWAYATDIDKYKDDTMLAADGYTLMSGAAPSSDGYIMTLRYDAATLFAFRPASVGGASTTYLCDYYYQAAGLRVLALGGAFYYGTNAGVFFVSANLASSFAYVDCGGRLLYLPR